MGVQGNTLAHLVMMETWGGGGANDSLYTNMELRTLEGMLDSRDTQDTKGLVVYLAHGGIINTVAWSRSRVEHKHIHTILSPAKLSSVKH